MRELQIVGFGQDLRHVESSSSCCRSSRKGGHSWSRSQVANFVYLVGSREPLIVFGESNIIKATFCKDSFGTDKLQG